MAISQQFATIQNLNGGLATRPTPLLIEANYTEQMKSPAIRNVDFFTKGSIAKRLGKTKQGATVATISTYASQLGAANTYNVVGGNYPPPIVAMKFTSTGIATINQINVRLATSLNLLVAAQIFSDVAGAPGVLLSVIGYVNTIIGNVPSLLNFTGSGTFTLAAGTNYWIVLSSGTSAPGVIVYYDGQTGTLARTSINGGSTYQNPSVDIYYALYSTAVGTTAIQGLYDYRFGASSTQNIVSVVNGGLYNLSGGVWGNLVGGLGNGQNNIWSFVTLKDYLFTLDNGNSVGRVWNGLTAYTTVLGYRPAGSVTNSAGGGTVTTGVYKVLLVTTLKSGGFRSSIEYTVTTTSGTDKIAITALAVDGTGASDFGFDINPLATKVFMTTIGGAVYYKVPTASISVAANPIPNNTTSLNITAPPVGTENTLLDEYGLLQAYFTTQTASPIGKYMSIFQNMIGITGDSTNPSRVWFSGIADGTSIAGPNIWGTAGGLYGNYRDFGVSDGEVITGIKEWNGNLYVFKRHSVFLVAFTGIAGNPFQERRLVGNLGALSHWSIKETPKGLVFLSERGPAICTGTNVMIMPSAVGILDRFDLNNANRYNLSAMTVATAGNNSTKQQIHWGVSSTSATTRDITLVYDYENEAFWENDVQANYYAEVTDANFFPSIWSGDYSAQVFRHDLGTNDNGAAINFYFDTPLLQLGAAFSWKQLTQIFIAGNVQSSGTLYVDVFLENSTTVAQTISFDMSRADFKSGQSNPCGLRGRMFRLRVRNSDLDIPVEIDSIMLGYNSQGSQY